MLQLKLDNVILYASVWSAVRSWIGLGWIEVWMVAIGGRRVMVVVL
jgi:hypothetical protein